MATRRLMIIEDNDEDFRAILRALDRSEADVAITRSIDGDDALDLLRDQALGPRDETIPEVILLDLNLPGTDGREVLASLKSDDLLKMIPVVVLSTSTAPTDVADCYRLGASGFCVKPVDRAKFDETIAAIYAYWIKSVRLPERAYLS